MIAAAAIRGRSSVWHLRRNAHTTKCGVKIALAEHVQGPVGSWPLCTNCARITGSLWNETRRDAA
jgi:hypothetical protein